MTSPDFIVIGAMKCGTSTLAEQLAAQAGVFITSPKEPNYFSDDDIYARGSEWYARLFETAAPGDCKGEASTHYTKLPTYPQTVARIKSYVPAARLIYVIRNPIDRAISHYIHEWSERRMGGDTSSAFKEAQELIDYGRYGYQIAPYVEAFGKENVLLTSLEQIRFDPDRELEQIRRFLGLQNPLSWQSELRASNISAKRIRTFPMRKLLVDNPVMRPLRRVLIPKSARVWVWNQLTIKKRPEISSATRADLEKVFLRDRDELHAFFPNHPALDLCYPFASQ